MIIDDFRGEHAFYSNFYKCNFVWAGIRWPTSEHAYQAAKATGSEKHEWIDKIIACKTPGMAKRLGKKVPLRKRWNDIRVDIMRRIVRQKFVQNPSLMRKLIDSGDAILIEGNNWRDNFWGADPANNPEGENWLGKVLMEIREEFRNKTDSELKVAAQFETVGQMEDDR